MALVRLPGFGCPKFIRWRFEDTARFPLVGDWKAQLCTCSNRPNHLSPDSPSGGQALSACGVIKWISCFFIVLIARFLHLARQKWSWVFCFFNFQSMSVYSYVSYLLCPKLRNLHLSCCLFGGNLSSYRTFKSSRMKRSWIWIPCCSSSCLDKSFLNRSAVFM